MATRQRRSTPKSYAPKEQLKRIGTAASYVPVGGAVGAGIGAARGAAKVAKATKAALNRKGVKGNPGATAATKVGAKNKTAKAVREGAKKGAAMGAAAGAGLGVGTVAASNLKMPERKSGTTATSRGSRNLKPNRSSKPKVDLRRFGTKAQRAAYAKDQKPKKPKFGANTVGDREAPPRPKPKTTTSTPTASRRTSSGSSSSPARRSTSSTPSKPRTAAPSKPSTSSAPKRKPTGTTSPTVNKNAEWARKEQAQLMADRKAREAAKQSTNKSTKATKPRMTAAQRSAAGRKAFGINVGNK
jgi:hypothetical protein